MSKSEGNLMAPLVLGYMLKGGQDGFKVGWEN